MAADEPQLSVGSGGRWMLKLYMLRDVDTKTDLLYYVCITERIWFVAAASFSLGDIVCVCIISLGLTIDILLCIAGPKCCTP